MAVMISLGSQSTIMSDGDWNGSPDNYFQNGSVLEVEDVNKDTEDFISFDLSGYDLSAAADGSTIEMELEVLGDHNNSVGESLTIETTYGGVIEDTSTLLVDGYTGFWQGETGPTTTGAQPSQGDLYIELADGTVVRSVLPAGTGDSPTDNFTAAVVDEIIANTATLYSGDGESNTITGSLDLDPTADALRFDLTIPSENSPEDGVDISQTTATVKLAVDFDSDKDISNMVFYFGNNLNDDCLKLKIDGFDDFWENLNEAGFDSTSTSGMMIDEVTLEQLFSGCDLSDYDLNGNGDWTDDWYFGGFSTKAGNNFDRGYADNPSQARGEGEYIGEASLAEECYGDEVACEIDAARYDAFNDSWVSNIDAIFA